MSWFARQVSLKTDLGFAFILIPFRKLDYQNQYHKWQWIEIDITKNKSDFRPESYRPINIEQPFIVGERIGTKDNWNARKKLVLNRVYTNMTELIQASKDENEGISLAVLKPKKVIDFVWEECKREWDTKKISAIEANQRQLNLFDDEAAKKFFQVVKKLPYKFSYVFTTEDNTERTLMIEDWELGQLYWNCLKSCKGDENAACQKVKEKYFDYMVNKCDLHFFLGTTRVYHKISISPFIIIGTFYPLKETPDLQLSLF